MTARTAHQERISSAMKAHWRRRKARKARERTGLFRYVRYADVEGYHLRGWMIVADLGPAHGAYSCLMWRCECREV